MSLQFRPPAWAHHTNLYEVNLRQYTAEGTFNSFAKHLPRLKDMGVETLWFMPITPIAQKNKKGTLGSYYACSDYTAVNPEFGTINDFKNFVSKAHQMGFKVIIDWVANHTGWDHVWTKQHPDWYKREADGSFRRASGMDDIIELDFTNAGLRKAMINAMKFWIAECDIDGFRCDLAFWVELNFWKEARIELDAIKNLFWFGEYDPFDSPTYDDVFDAAYTWAWMHKTEEFYKKNLPLNELITVLKKYDDLSLSSMSVWFTSNHDENSWNGTEYEKYGDMAKVLAVFSCTWNGLPLIYSGQELPNKKRLKFFDKDAIEWTNENQLHGFYKTLLCLHSSNPALRAEESTFVIKTNNEKIFAYLRKNGNDEVLVILNFSKEKQELKVEEDLLNGQFRDMFTNTKIDLSLESKLEMDAWGFYVFEKSLQ